MKNKSKGLFFADRTNLRASFLQETETRNQFGALQWEKVLCGRDSKVQMQVSSHCHIITLYWPHPPSGQASWCQGHQCPGARRMAPGPPSGHKSPVSGELWICWKSYFQSCTGLVHIRGLLFMEQLTPSCFITKSHKQSPTNVQR